MIYIDNYVAGALPDLNANTIACKATCPRIATCKSNRIPNTFVLSPIQCITTQT